MLVYTRKGWLLSHSWTLLQEFFYIIKWPNFTFLYNFSKKELKHKPESEMPCWKRCEIILFWQVWKFLIMMSSLLLWALMINCKACWCRWGHKDRQAAKFCSFYFLPFYFNALLPGHLDIFIKNSNIIQRPWAPKVIVFYIVIIIIKTYN